MARGNAPRWIRMMKDYGIERPAAGQAATQPASRKPRPPQRDRRRATTGAARKRHPGAGERKPADAVQPRHSWGTGGVCPSVEMFHAKYRPHPCPEQSHFKTLARAPLRVG